MQFSKNKRNIQWDKYMVYIIFVVVFILFAIILGNKGFVQPRNLINILRQTAMISVMAVAGVFVMAAGQIDLTVGSITAMTAMIVSLVIQSTNNIFLALIAGIGFGVAVGCINGLLVTKLKLPAFLATLGTMELVRGAAMWITDTAAVPIENETFCKVFGIGEVAGIPVLVLWTVLFYIVGILLFNRTPFGRHVLATGGNENSAIYSGINTQKVKIIAFTMSGGVAAFAGIMYAARMQAGRYSYGDGDVGDRGSCTRRYGNVRRNRFRYRSALRICADGNDEQCGYTGKFKFCTADYDQRRNYYTCGCYKQSQPAEKERLKSYI